jgi:hypothetical protein
MEPTNTLKISKLTKIKALYAIIAYILKSIK